MQVNGYPNHNIAQENSVDFQSLFGGSDDEHVYGFSGLLHVDINGAMHIAGTTSSTDLPITADAHQDSIGGGQDAFYAIISEDGELVQCSYFGGTGREVATGIFKDYLGNTVLLGHTSSTDLVTMNAIQNTSAGLDDMFLASFAPNGSLMSSTYFGGSDNDWATGITADYCGNIIVIGNTFSADFPVIEAFQPDFGGENDGFVIKILKNGTFRFASFFGGSGSDGLNGVDVNLQNNIVVSGYTESTDLPTINPLQSEYSGNGDVMLGIVNRSGADLFFSSYFGGSEYDRSRSIVSDIDGGITFVGDTESQDFSTTPGVFQSNITGERDGFITRISDITYILEFSTFIGGLQDDSAIDLVVVPDNGIYIVGETMGDSFPLQNQLHDHHGGRDIYVAWISLNGQSLIQSTMLGGSSHETGGSIGLDVQGRIIVCTSSDSEDVQMIDSLSLDSTGGRDILLTRMFLMDIGITSNSGGNEPFSLTIEYLIIFAGVISVSLVVLFIIIRKRR